MGQTLPHGVYLPDNGERNCYTGLSQNWQKLDNLIGSHGDTVSFAQTLTEGVEIGKITINGVDVSLYHTDYSSDIASKANASDVYTKAEVDASLSEKADKATTLSGYGITDAYTKAQVDNKISGLVNSAPETLDTLNELASALGNDPNFATTVSTEIGKKLDTTTASSTYIAKGDGIVGLTVSGKVITYTKGDGSTGTITTQDTNTTYESMSAAEATTGTATTARSISAKVLNDKIDEKISGKANDSNVVHTSGDETIGGNKRITNALNFFASGGRRYDVFANANGISSTLNISGPDKSKSVTVGYYNEEGSYVPSSILACNGDIRPSATNTNNLGSSSYKWKSFNGVNPGALSLPSMSHIQLDTSSFDTTSTTIGTFASTVDGWAIVSISQKNKHFGIWILNGDYRVTFNSVHHDDDYMLFALIPVRANINMTIYCTSNDIDSTRVINFLRLFPCQGNV